MASNRKARKIEVPRHWTIDDLVSRAARMRNQSPDIITLTLRITPRTMPIECDLSAARTDQHQLLSRVHDFDQLAALRLLREAIDDRMAALKLGLVLPLKKEITRC